MTKKETELFEGLVTLVKQSMEVQVEILKNLRLPQTDSDLAKWSNPDVNPDGVGVALLEPTVLKNTLSTATDLPPAADEPEAPAPPVVTPPKVYTIEDCRQVLGVMVEKLGEKQAWTYLKTFKVTILITLFLFIFIFITKIVPGSNLKNSTISNLIQIVCHHDTGIRICTT